MKHKRIIVLLAALSLAGSALSEPVDTEYLVDMTSEQVVRLEQRLSVVLKSILPHRWFSAIIASYYKL